MGIAQEKVRTSMNMKFNQEVQIFLTRLMGSRRITMRWTKLYARTEHPQKFEDYLGGSKGEVFHQQEAIAS